MNRSCCRDRYAGVQLIWYDGGLRHRGPEGLPEGSYGDNGRMLVGEKGFILGASQNQRRSGLPGVCAKDAAEVAHTLRVPPGLSEWLDACKAANPQVPISIGPARWPESVLLGNVALRMQLAKN